jgi:YbgC/YbaW family acyl-CoA thioester hydrolase
MRQYRWGFRLRSYEGDAWGQLSSAGLLRYFEQSAVDAAADAGYGSEFHDARNSGWVIRRMYLVIDAPMRAGSDLEIVTWASHFARVRGGREYRVHHPRSDRVLARGLAEWVYVDRQTLAPLALPKELAQDFATPGAPLGSYDPPVVAPLDTQPEFTAARTAEWHEADAFAHVNNAVYAEWLDEAVKLALAELGWSTRSLMEAGLQLRGEYHALDYRRAAVPEDRVQIITRIEGVSGRLLAVRQVLTDEVGATYITASSVYGWRTIDGEPSGPPEGWNLGTGL